MRSEQIVLRFEVLIMVFNHRTSTLSVPHGILELLLLAIHVFPLAFKPGWEMEELPDQTGLKEG